MVLQRSLPLVFLLSLSPACVSPEKLGEGLQGAPEAEWQSIGPGGGGAQYIPTISPGDPGHVFVRCDMTGSYVTENGGQTWRMFNLKGVVRDFEFDPRNPTIVYAGSTGLYRSEDRGRRWHQIYPRPADVVRETMHGDHASHQFMTKGEMPEGTIVQIRVDPTDSDRLYIGVSPSGRAGESAHVLESTDRGQSWRELAEVPGRQVLAIFPGSWNGRDGEIRVVTERALARVSLGDGSVEDLALPVDEVRVADGGRGPGPSSFIYVLGTVDRGGRRTESGIFRSSDLGRTWEEAGGTLEESSARTGRPAEFTTLAVCESQPETVYLSCSTYWELEEGFPQRYSGIFKTTDAGRTWEWVLSVCGGRILSRNFKGGWLLRNLGWLRNPSYLGVSPTNGDIVYGTDSGRTFKSENGGVNWEQLISDDLEDGSFTTRGLDVTTTYGVHFDPFDPQHLFITYTDIGLFHSFNGGRSWHHAIAGIPRQWRNTCYWLEFDPAVRGRIFSVWSNVHDLPRPKMYRSGNLVNGNQQGGVAVSGDGGSWWELLSKGVMAEDGTHHMGIRPGAVCTHLVLDPESPVESRKLYVCDYGYGVWKSTDSGRTWEIKTRGISADNRYCWRLTRLPSGRLILLVARGGIEGREMIPGALYASDDEAEEWRRLPLPVTITAPNDLVYDPANPDRMYLSCWPFFQDGAEVGGGLYRTEDGGQTWSQVFQQDVHVYAAAVDPHNTDTIYINTFHGSALRSDDRGQTWRRLGGYNFKWGHRPIPDIRHPDRLYLTTFGGSVFYGPAQGVPGAFEDIVNLKLPTR